MTTETATALSDLRPTYVYLEPEGYTWWCRVCTADGPYLPNVAQAHDDARDHATACPVLRPRSVTRKQTPPGGLHRTPLRVQRQRTRGWRMPAGAVFVGRNTRWSNPWIIGAHMPTVLPGGTIDLEPRLITRQLAVASYRNRTEWLMGFDDFAAELRAELAWRDLACWCNLDDECHADILLALAAT